MNCLALKRMSRTVITIFFSFIHSISLLIRFSLSVLLPSHSFLALVQKFRFCGLLPCPSHSALQNAVSRRSLRHRH